MRSFFALEWVGEDDLYLQTVSEVAPRLFVGRRPAADRLAELSGRGITHVVSCLDEKQRSSVDFLSTEFEHTFLPTVDEMHQDLADTFDAFFDVVDGARDHNPDLSVLVHCEVGVSRSASLAIALVMRDERMTFLDAFELVRSKRVQVLPNIAFASQLQRLEHRLRPERRADGRSSLATYLSRYCSAPGEVGELDAALRRHDFDAVAALRSIYGGEIPRVVQGVRSIGR